ncbi:DMT family transporter, partial [Proteus mirabilis]|uniref:DMT family transporter n=1 Tax=Proteus mirabilis TaxID=584 RepID=UPI0025789085
MNGLTYLILAIISDVIATTVLKASDGFSRLYPSLVVVVGYGFSFWALSQVVKVMPLGLADAI